VVKLLFSLVFWFAVGSAVGFYLPKSEEKSAIQIQPRIVVYSAQYAEALDPRGPYGIERAEEFLTPAGKFIVALTHAGLVNNTLRTVNYHTAWALLNELAKENSGNAAYLYYRLSIEILDGHEASQIEKTGFDILKSTAYFNPYAAIKNRLVRELASRQVGSKEVLVNFPEVDDVAIFSAAETYLSQAPSVRKHLARLMNRSGSLINQSASVILDIDQVSNTIGNSIAQNACPKIDLPTIATFNEKSGRNVFASY
jgi:hypothetical protein